jgi:hypothetical protein
VTNNRGAGAAQEQSMDITYEQWAAKAVELFGPDVEAWRFRCPNCGNELSLAEAKQLYPELAGKGWRVEQECIGRYTRKVNCDWAAYGLFSGPVFVAHNGKKIPAFDFAGRPFTSEEASPQAATPAQASEGAGNV